MQEPFPSLTLIPRDRGRYEQVRHAQYVSGLATPPPVAGVVTETHGGDCDAAEAARRSVMNGSNQLVNRSYHGWTSKVSWRQTTVGNVVIKEGLYVLLLASHLAVHVSSRPKQFHYKPS